MTSQPDTIDFSLVIPTYNERANLTPLLNLIQETLTGHRYEVLIVDDDSPDGTWKLAQDYALTHDFVRVIRRQQERGLSSAVVEGFRQSRGHLLGVMDADLSHDVRLLPALLKVVENGSDIAVGSRRVPGGGADHWPWYRQITSRVATVLAKSILFVDIQDPMSGYFVLRRDVYERSVSRLSPTGYKILLEIVMKSKPVKLVEVPFIFKDRKQGYSKLSSGVILNYINQLLRLRLDQWKNQR